MARVRGPQLVVRIDDALIGSMTGSSTSARHSSEPGVGALTISGGSIDCNVEEDRQQVLQIEPRDREVRVLQILVLLICTRSSFSWYACTPRAGRRPSARVSCSNPRWSKPVKLIVRLPSANRMNCSASGRRM